VTWSATPGTVSSAGLFTAPQVTSNSTATVTATSVADPTKSASASVSVTAPAGPPIVSVAVTPPSATIASGGSAQFTALVSNTTNTSVTWTATPGTISSSGLYTAPAVTSSAVATITATSAAVITQSASATVTINPTAPPIAVTVVPATATVAPGGTNQFTAQVSNSSDNAVTWTATQGTVSTTGLYTAPAGTSITAATVTASSVADPTKSASATVTITAQALPVVVTITPATATVASGASSQFNATVSNTSNTAVTWSTTQGTVSSGGLYTAPAVTANSTASVTATSAADTTKSAGATVTLTAPVATPLSIASTTPTAGTSAIAYTYSFTASGGKPLYTWTLTSGSLPNGIALQSSGSISGTTTQTGTFTFTLQASDSSSPNQTISQSFSLTVTNSGGVTNPLPSANYFGFSENNTASSNFPSVSYGMQRFWDSPPLQWPSINTAPGVFDFSKLDSALAQAYSGGVMNAFYTLARTPPWATSKPTDTTCHYTTASSGGGNGECDAPSDLNADGSGTNATWKAWIAAIAAHVNSSGYTASHAHIKYWEIWNEPDTQPFWAGSIAQLARLTEDANCIITGRGVIHQSGNGSATPCTATPIDPTALIVMASAHAKGVALTFGQNELYCNNTGGIPAYELPCPNPANAIATAIDIVNFHMKPGNESGNTCPAPTLCTPESAMQWYVSNVEGILQPAERAKPLWDGEASFSEYGFTGAYTDPDMAASFMPRYYLVNWSLGISGMAWYVWDNLLTEPVQVQTSYQEAYNWLANSSLDVPCAATGSVWSCTISKSGTQYLILWDNSQSCASGACTTANQPVAANWAQYQDMTISSTPSTINSHTVPVGIKPVLLN
jgi:hypothetical protein